MSTWAPVRISCDWPDCHGRYDTFLTRVSEARAMAAKQGWRTVPSIGDFCGSPDQGEKHAVEAGSWAGHGQRTDHVPIAKPAGKGHVRLTCSCGWSYRSYPWQEPGVAYRSTATFRWQTHVREALAAEDATPSGSGK